MSFRLKTILGIALIEITLLPILIIMSINYLKNSNEEQLRYRANNTAILFAKSVQDAVLSYDLATLDSLVSHLLNDPAIVYIRISNNNQVLTEGGDNAVLQQTRALDTSLDRVKDGIFDVAVPIEGSGLRYGTVSLGMSTDMIEQTIKEASQYISSVALGQIILVMLLSLAFGTYLTRQLRRLEEASIKISSIGPGHQIDIRGNDEIAATMRAFNTMSQSLLQSQNESDKSKEAYQQLALVAANNEAKTKATLEACLDGIITIDSNGVIVEYNDQAELIFGWSKEEMLGTTLSAKIIPEDMRESHQQGMTHFLETGDGPVLNQRLELPALNRKGSQITVEISIVPVEIDGQQMFTAFLHDITAQKEATDAIKQARIAADQANQAKTRFLATMSHEIRSPLNAVINMNELLLESSLDEQQKKFANIAHEGGLTLLALINDILDFSKIEAGEIKLNNSRFNPTTMIQTVVELHAGLAANQGLTLDTVFHPALNRNIVSDELRLRQIVTNLLSNAIKFTHQGSIIIRLEPDDKPDFLRLSVTDTGEGIPLEKQADIFGEFKQLEDQDNRRFAGSGLGLAITHRLIKLFGGTINVDSQPGKGSCFSVVIPLTFADDETNSERSDTLPQVNTGPEKNVLEGHKSGNNEPENSKKIACKVLLVDDSQSNLAVGEALLTPMGCEVVTAINGEAAIQQASQQRYDIIFMDLAMPIIDGLKATTMIRETPGPNQKTVIVALTANAFSEDRERCLANGMTDYLSKPIIRSQLIDMVKRYGNTHSQQDIDNNQDKMVTDNNKITTSNQEKNDNILDKTVLEKLKQEVSVEALPTILGIYLDELDKRIKLIEQYNQAGDINALGTEAHALKSSSASFGALSLAEKARELELAIRESNHQTIDLHMQNLQPLAQQSIAAINTYLTELNSGTIEQ